MRNSAAGVLTTQSFVSPPASRRATALLGSSESRLASTQPALPPPTTKKSTVSFEALTGDSSRDRTDGLIRYLLRIPPRIGPGELDGHIRIEDSRRYDVICLPRTAR